MEYKLNRPIKPDLSKLFELLEKVNRNEWFTNFGPLHNSLTEELEKYFDVENLLLVTNATLGLQIITKVFDLKNIISTPFSFIATSSSMVWQDVKIQYADIDKSSLNICHKKVENILKKNGKNIDAILATHLYGNVCKIDELEKLAKENKTKLIFDAAHAFGVNFKNQSILKYGDASVISFHATKLFHTIEGGAIIFKEKNDYLKAKDMINFGLNNYKILQCGINAKMNEYQAAVGLVNILDIDKVIAKRVQLFDTFYSALDKKIKRVRWDKRVSKNGAYLPIILDNEKERERIKEYLKLNNIESREYFDYSLDQVFNSESCPISNDFSKRVLCLPLHYYLEKKDMVHMATILNEAFGKN